MTGRRKCHEFYDVFCADFPILVTVQPTAELLLNPAIKSSLSAKGRIHAWLNPGFLTDFAVNAKSWAE